MMGFRGCSSVRRCDARWWTTLQAFQIKVLYCKNAAHVCLCAISRGVCVAREGFHEEVKCGIIEVL